MPAEKESERVHTDYGETLLLFPNAKTINKLALKLDKHNADQVIFVGL